MEIVNEYEIASANLALALQNDAVSTEHREAIRTAVDGDLDKMMDAMNTVIVAMNAKVYGGTMTPERAKKTVAAEFKAMGFEWIVEYKYLQNAVNLFYDRAEVLKEPGEKQVERIRAMWDQNQNCPVERVRDGVSTYSLRLLSHLGIVTVDLDFTKSVMDEINGYDEGRKEKAILPPAIVTEL